MVEYVLTIEKQEHELQDFVEYLRYVAKQIEEGNRQGDGWDTNEAEA